MHPDLDLSRPVRGVVGLERLVRHVLASDPKNESDWIEWKRSLALDEAPGRFQAAKHVLGFANRHPDRARRHAGGCGYLILGAEPESLVGQAPMDPSEIEAGLGPYLGESGPAWTPVWVAVDPVQCLVIMVEPPDWGDSIHPLRRGFESTQPGQIFVRRAGATHQASPDEISMLEERLVRRGTDPLSVELQHDGGPLSSLDLDETGFDEWIDAERQRLLAPLRKEQARDQRQADGVPISSITKAVPSLKVAADLERAMSTFRSLEANVLGDRIEPEKRNPEEYEEEVEQYLARAREVLPYAVVGASIDRKLAALLLKLRNPTDRNVPAVEVKISFDGSVSSFEPGHETEGLPEPPRPWGPRTVPSPLHSVLAPSPLYLPRFDAALDFDDFGPGFECDNHGSTTIVFDPVDLRPRETVQLPGVSLVIEAPVGPELPGKWTATSTGFDGVTSGVLKVPVDDHTLTPLELLG